MTKSRLVKVVALAAAITLASLAGGGLFALHQSSDNPPDPEACNSSYSLQCAIRDLIPLIGWILLSQDQSNEGDLPQTDQPTTADPFKEMDVKR